MPFSAPRDDRQRKQSRMVCAARGSAQHSERRAGGRHTALVSTALVTPALVIDTTIQNTAQAPTTARETTRQILIHSQRGRCPVARAFITVRIRITYGVCTRTCLRFGVVNHRKPQQFADASVGAEREQTQKLAEAAKSSGVTLHGVSDQSFRSRDKVQIHSKSVASMLTNSRYTKPLIIHAPTPPTPPTRPEPPSRLRAGYGQG